VLRALGIAVGAALLVHGPNYVTSLYKDVADWANKTFYVCVAVAVAIHLWNATMEIRALIRDRHQMLPARQY